MKSGDEANETNTHHQNNSRSDFQAWSVVGVEPEHVAAAAGSGDGGGVGGSSETTTAHTGGGGGGATGSYADRAGSGV